MKISKILRRKQKHRYLENVKLPCKISLFHRTKFSMNKVFIIVLLWETLWSSPWKFIFYFEDPRKMPQINMWPCLWSSCDHPCYVCSFISHIHFCALGVELFAIELLIETRELVYVNLLLSVDSVGNKSKSVWEKRRGKELTMVFVWSNNHLTPHAWP
jgi:hypothetical protein